MTKDQLATKLADIAQRITDLASEVNDLYEQVENEPVTSEEENDQ